MGDTPTFGRKETPFLGPGAGGTGEWLLLRKNQAVFDRHAHEPGQVVHVQLGHQAGTVLFGGSHADLQGSAPHRRGPGPRCHLAGRGPHPAGRPSPRGGA
jgi:hypothetical protein